MKTIRTSGIFLAVFLLSWPGFVAAQTVKKALSEITDVTVYRRGAQVTRKGQITLTDGRNEVHFTHLAPNIDPNSILVMGSPRFTILSVHHQHNYLDHPTGTGKEKDLQEKKERLEFDLAVSQSEVKVYEAERTMLQSNKKLGSENQNMVIEDLIELADYYRDRMKEIHYKILDLKEQQNDLKKAIGSISRQLEELRYGKGKNTGEIHIALMVATPGSVKVEVKFLVHDAGWAPEYDLRTNDITGPVALTYKGRVWQHTGYDWEQVNIKLHTGDPAVSHVQPKITPWVLALDRPVQRGARSGGRVVYMDGVVKQHDEQVYEDEVKEEVEITRSKNKDRNDTPFAHHATQVASGIHNEFEVRIPYSIPSDGQQYRVEIGQHRLPADYAYYMAPAYQTDAFLMARVTGWEELALLPADAHVYYQGTYVGKSFLNPAITGDTLHVSMGRDAGIVAERKKMSDHSQTTAVGNHKKTTVGIEIRLRNAKNKRVAIRITDQIPLSNHKEVGVVLKEWSGAKHNAATGELEWNMVLGPSDAKTLMFQYEVKIPKGRTLENF